MCVRPFARMLTMVQVAGLLFSEKVRDFSCFRLDLRAERDCSGQTSKPKVRRGEAACHRS